MSNNLMLRPIARQEISASTTSARNSTALTRDDVRVFCATSDVYINIGNSTVTATTATSGSVYFLPSGQAFDFSTKGATHIAVILASGTATVHITELTNKAF